MTTTYTDAQPMSLEQVRDQIASWYGGSEACLDDNACAVMEPMIKCIDHFLAERKAAIQTQGGDVANLVIGGYGDNDANFNHCHEQASKALRYLAEKPCPNGGEQFPNSECCYMIAEELDRSFAAIKRHVESQPPQHVHGDGGDVRGDVSAALDAVPTVGWVWISTRESDGADCHTGIAIGEEMPRFTLKGFRYEYRALIGREKAKTFFADHAKRAVQS